MKTLEYYFDYTPEAYNYIMSSQLLRNRDKQILKSFVATMNGHITAIIDNVIVDTFDCSNRIIKCCWQIM